MAGQSATLLPGGIAARAGLLEQVGVKPAKSGPAILLSSLTDQAMFIITSIIAALFFESARKPVLIVLGFLIALSILLGIEATRCWLLNTIEAILGKLKLGKFWNGFKESMECTLSWELVLKGLASTAVSFAMLVLALYLCCRGVGAEIWAMTILLAFSLPTMLGRISALPAGVGVTEVGMVAIIDAAPNVTLNQAAAAVAVFRVSTILATALFGGLLYLFNWKKTVKKECEESPPGVKAAS
jgi:uncharacterized protein (TIRG00374 family)